MRPARAANQKSSPSPQRKGPQKSRNILGSLLRFLSGDRRNNKI
jgi:hypothetical protein